VEIGAADRRRTHLDEDFIQFQDRHRNVHHGETWTGSKLSECTHGPQAITKGRRLLRHDERLTVSPPESSPAGIILRHIRLKDRHRKHHRLYFIHRRNMADDRITIDPEFLPHSRKGGGRPTAWFATGAAVVAAIAFGWLLGSPGSREPADVAAADSTTTTVTTTTSTTVVTTTTLPAPDPLGVSPVPLSDLVPGFTDTILLLTTPVDEFNIARWSASQMTPDVALVIDRDDAHLTGGWPIGLDASGAWFAQILGDGVLTVHALPSRSEPPPPREAIGLRAGSAVWHNTEPGQLAWLTCARSTPGPATVMTLDLTNPAAEPVPLSSIPQVCASDWDEGVFLESWSDQALILSQPWDGRSEPILLDVDGGGILSEPDEPVLIESSYGRYYPPAPGVAEDELVVATARSPDGKLAAVNITPEIDRTASLVRVVDVATGGVVGEWDGQGSGVISMTWSTDSKFLIYSTLRSSFKPGLPGPLIIHHVETGATTAITLSNYVDEIRTQVGEGADPIP
jgi:hypothetical protein